MEQGLVLMVVGMATVFAFLVLLVAAMNLSASFFTKFAHLFPEAPQSTGTVAASDNTAVAVALASIRAKRG